MYAAVYALSWMRARVRGLFRQLEDEQADGSESVTKPRRAMNSNVYLYLSMSSSLAWWPVTLVRIVQLLSSEADQPFTCVTYAKT